MNLFLILLQFGMPRDPEMPQTVLYHISNDPLRREKLRCGRNTLLCDFHILFQQSKGIVFQLRIEILIQTADDLHLIRPVFFRNTCHHSPKNAVLSKDIVRKQQFGIAAHPLKHLRRHSLSALHCVSSRYR